MLGLTFAVACSVPVTSVVGGDLVPHPVDIKTKSAHVEGQALRISNVFIAALLCPKNSQQRVVLGVT